MASPKKKTLALIAHDGKKADMIGFVKDNIEFLKTFNLVATSTTGKMVMQTGLKVKRYLSGPLGGDAQITALVATGKCHAVIFMRDPLGMHPHEPDISSLLRICEVHDVPLATNLSSAQLIVKGLHKNLLKE
ncbi:methylglyoxal synthase [Bacteriovorax stolpii]|uniref:Methylglyoxal synthase n=1 Tax=Bacteriovorax stolpii TaxID=960 RepID=A0A2K9NUT2_BACTC|nr:methylglyoxal synthase [Bacteriovorax stolpii]AUN99237.1 methylglyoxal synthase [Bacteriovorax stolpii]QDK40782.1 methylglyoxal synthase [Bacteriovorax stolpii]TDP55223.1 methylglyoxal synthase [Bacteriovorax stolpii]